MGMDTDGQAGTAAHVDAASFYCAVRMAGHQKPEHLHLDVFDFWRSGFVYLFPGQDSAYVCLCRRAAGCAAAWTFQDAAWKHWQRRRGLFSDSGALFGCGKGRCAAVLVDERLRSVRAFGNRLSNDIRKAAAWKKDCTALSGICFSSAVSDAVVTALG